MLICYILFIWFDKVILFLLFFIFSLLKFVCKLLLSLKFDSKVIGMLFIELFNCVLFKVSCYLFVCKLNELLNLLDKLLFSVFVKYWVFKWFKIFLNWFFMLFD